MRQASVDLLQTQFLDLMRALITSLCHVFLANQIAAHYVIWQGDHQRPHQSETLTTVSVSGV